MAIVTVTVNGHDYQVACDDGQEEHLTGLAEFVNKRVSKLTKTMGQVGEARLILMASLLIADEVSDYVDEVEALREELDLAADEASEAAGSAVERMADRIESIAARLETG